MLSALITSTSRMSSDYKRLSASPPHNWVCNSKLQHFHCVSIAFASVCKRLLRVLIASAWRLYSVLIASVVRLQNDQRASTRTRSLCITSGGAELRRRSVYICRPRPQVLSNIVEPLTRTQDHKMPTHRKTTKEKKVPTRKSPRKTRTPPPAGDGDGAPAPAVSRGKGFSKPGSKRKGKTIAPVQPVAEVEEVEDVEEIEDEGKDSDGSEAKDTKAKAKSKYTLPLLMEESLLEWLQENPILWRKGHMEYRDIGKRNAMWEEKATELDKPVDYLKKWWKGLHDVYVRNLKRTSGQAAPTLTDRVQWVMGHCAFYKSEARHRTAPLKNVSTFLNTWILYYNIMNATLSPCSCCLSQSRVFHNTMYLTIP